MISLTCTIIEWNITCKGQQLFNILEGLWFLFKLINYSDCVDYKCLRWLIANKIVYLSICIGCDFKEYTFFMFCLQIHFCKKGNVYTVGLLFMWIWMYPSLKGYNKRVSTSHKKANVS